MEMQHGLDRMICFAAPWRKRTQENLICMACSASGSPPIYSLADKPNHL